VSGFFAVTATPGNAPLCASMTRPFTSPVVAWDCAAAWARGQTQTHRAKINRRDRTEKGNMVVSFLTLLEP
jgi:hypothetical protein